MIRGKMDLSTAGVLNEIPSGDVLGMTVTT